MMKGTKFMIALACALALSGTFAFAQTPRHKHAVRPHHAHRSVPQMRSGFSYPGYSDPAPPSGTVSAGGYLWNGRSASEFGGD